MILKPHDAPHIRHNENTRVLMIDAILAMLFLYGMAYFYYGPRVLVLGAAGLLTALACDILGVLFARRKLNTRDFSPIVTGMLLPLFFPAAIDYHVVVAGAVFAILVAKHPFGGVGHNVFNPAAAGFSFAAICFPDKVFAYTAPSVYLPLAGPIETPFVNSPAFTLSLGGVPRLELVDMLLGSFPGPMGATNILVLIACLLYLLFRRTVRWQTPVFFLLSVAFVSFAFPRGGEGLTTLSGAEIAAHELIFQGEQVALDFTARATMTAYEMMSGCLLLGAIFLLGDPVTTPKRDWSKIAFGIVSGVMAMLFRRYGGFEEAVPFAVLLMNASVWGFDMVGERLAHLLRSRDREKTV